MSMFIKATAPTGDSVKFDMLWENLEDCKTVGWLPALLMPVRTNTWTNFKKDLFSPTIHHATRVKGVVCQIFAVLGALFLDILTLPIRLLTSLPRHFYIISHRHPVYKAIQDELQAKMDLVLYEESIDEERIKKLEGLKKVFQKAEYVRLEPRWKEREDGTVIDYEEEEPNAVLCWDDFTLRLIQQPQGTRLD